MKRAEQPFDRAEVESAIAAIGTPGEAAALSALCAAAKGKAAREYMEEALSRDRLYAALNSEEPKARKNAARLLGAFEREADAPALIAALDAETTRFVRPSLLLALGAAGGEKARKYLAALPEPVAADETEEKHAREEADALRRARARLSDAELHAFSGFSREHGALLRAPRGFAPLLKEELAGLNIRARSAGGDDLFLHVKALDALLQARCFFELLFPLAHDIQAKPAAVAEAVKEPLLALLKDGLAGNPPYGYRVECPDIPDRAAFISALAGAIDGAALTNNPSRYEAELRLSMQQNGTLSAVCKITVLPDERFSYRKRALPASMHPATAACVARCASGFVQDARRVLDPFCGSGTLLIEWSKLHPKSLLTGVDISRGALDIARENCAAANVRAGLVNADSAAFTARERYDLVLSNLPFGNRVGTHTENERLYAALIRNLPQWLAPGGVAVLYTMEYTLLSRCIKAEPRLTRVYETRTEAGGLTPWVVAVRSTATMNN